MAIAESFMALFKGKEKKHRRKKAVKAQVPKDAAAAKPPAPAPAVAALQKKVDKAANDAIKRANSLVASGQFVRAEECLLFIDELLPQETRHLTSLGNALIAQQRYSDAEQVLRRLTAANPTEAAPVRRLADALGGQGRHAEAAELLEKFLQTTDAGDEKRDRLRIQTHQNLAGIFSPAIAKERDAAIQLHEQSNAFLSPVQERVLEELKASGISQTTFSELFADDALWQEAEKDFTKFGSDPKVVQLIERISSAEDFSQDPELKDSFKPSIVNYRNFYGDITVNSPIARIYASDNILGIANRYNEMASKIRNMHMWINPPLHPNNVNGRMGSQLWHRDQEDSKILKCFIYFSDIDEGSGATDYVKNTAIDCSGLKDPIIPYPNSTGYPNEVLFQERAAKENFTRAEGKKGTIVFLDTNGFHRGGYVRDRSRYIAMCTFLRPISPFIEANTKLSFSGSEASGLSPLASYGLQ